MADEKQDKQTRRQRDIDLFHEWKTTGSKQALGALIGQISPLIYTEVQRQSGSLPPSALSAEGKRWAIRALKTYDPKHGAAISTHVVGYLRKVRRMNYRFQNLARLPENLQLQYHLWDKALQDLRDKLNRDPTEEEMAAALGWSKPQVIKYKNSLYEDLIESASAKPFETIQFNENKILLDHIMDQLTPEEKTIWEYSKKESSEELAKRLNVNVNRLNYLKSKLKNKVQTIKNSIGMY